MFIVEGIERCPIGLPSVSDWSTDQHRGHHSCSISTLAVQLAINNAWNRNSARCCRLASKSTHSSSSRNVSQERLRDFLLISWTTKESSKWDYLLIQVWYLIPFNLSLCLSVQLPFHCCLTNPLKKCRYTSYPRDLPSELMGCASEIQRNWEPCRPRPDPTHRGP